MNKENDMDKLINMGTDEFRNQLSNKVYSDYIQYLIKKNGKVKIAELMNYFFDSLSEDHELCRQSIGNELEKQIDKLNQIQCTDVFDLVRERMITWDENCTDNDIIDMFQVHSYTLVFYSFSNKNLKRALGVKTGWFS